MSRQSISVSILLFLAWAPLTGQDGRPSLAAQWIDDSPPGGWMGELGVDPFNAFRLYAVAGGQLFVSQDRGAEWRRASLEFETGYESLTFSSTRPGLIFALRNDPPVSELLRSEDGGGQWTKVVGQGTMPAFSSILALGPENRLLFVKDREADLLRSQDGGRTFKSIRPGPTFEVRSLALRPEDPDTLLAVDPSSVFRSQDGGDSWELVLGSGGPAAISPFRELAFLDSERAVLVGAGVWLSTDAGLSWTAQPNALPAEVDLLQASPSDPQRLYAANHWNVFRSDDGGIAWQMVTSPFSLKEILDLAVDPSNPNFVHAALSFAGVWTSYDAGLHWNLNSNGMGARTDEVLQAGEDWLAATDLGVFIKRSPDTRWRRTPLPGAGLTNDSALAAGRFGIYASSRGFYLSRDRGATWQRADSFDEPIFCRDLAAGEVGEETLIVCTAVVQVSGSYLILIRDDGRHLTVERNPSDFMGLNEIKIDPFDSRRIVISSRWSAFFGVRGGGLWISKDAGKSWLRSAPAGSMGLLGVELSSSQPGRLLTFEGLKLWLSDDLGETFQRLTSPTDSRSIQEVLIHPHDPDTFFLFTLVSAYVSFDAGRTWDQLGSFPLPGLVEEAVFSQDRPLELVASTWQGIFRLPLDGDVRRLPAAFPDVPATGTLMVYNPSDQSAAQAEVEFVAAGADSERVVIDVPKLGLRALDSPAGSAWSEVSALSGTPESLLIREAPRSAALISHQAQSGTITVPVLDGRIPGASTRLLLNNPRHLPQAVSLRLRNPDSGLLARASLSLDPRTSQSMTLSEIPWLFSRGVPLPNLDAFIGYLEVEATGMSAEGLMQLRGETALLTGASPPQVRGFAEPPQAPFRLYFAQFGDGEENGAFIRGRLVLFNHSNVPVQARLRAFDSQGGPLAEALEGFGADGTANVALGPGWLVLLEGTGDGPLKLGWVEVESNRRLEGWVILEGNLGAAVLRGSPETHRQASFPILNSGVPFASTAMVLANPSQEEITVSLTLHDGDGKPLAEAALPLPARAQRVRFLRDIPWVFEAGAARLDDFQGLLRADSPVPLASALLHLGPGAFALANLP